MPYYGEYECKLDDKGRLKVPAPLIRQLQPQHEYVFVIHRGIDKCLMMYEEHVWDEVAEKVAALNVYSAKERQFVRYFFRGATKVVMDGSGRIRMGKRLLEFAGIGKQLVLSSLGQRIELWSPEAYEQMVDSEPDDFSAMAEELFGRGIEDTRGASGQEGSGR